MTLLDQSELPLAMFTSMGQQDDYVRDKACLQLQRLFEDRSERLTTEEFTSYMNQVINQIFDLLKSQRTKDQLAGVVAIDALLQADTPNHEMKIVKLAAHLRLVFQECTDPNILVLATATLGRMARSGGSLNLTNIEFALSRALEWLKSGDSDHLLCAILILKNVAENAPSTFFQRVDSFIEFIDMALQAPKDIVRENAAAALGSCLTMISQREPAEQVHWYLHLYNVANAGFQRATTASLHGALLVVDELLRHSGSFLAEYFDGICDQVLRLKDNRSPLVRRTVSFLLPRLARFDKPIFVRDSLRVALKHMLRAMTQNSERATAFVALGRLAVAVGRALVGDLKKIFSMISDALITRSRKPFCHEALTCIALFAQALGPDLLTHVNLIGLLDQMFADGLNSTLVDALQELCYHIPQILPLVETKLVAEIGQILGGVAYTRPFSLLGLTSMPPADPGAGHTASSSLYSLRGRTTSMDLPPAAAAAGNNTASAAGGTEGNVDAGVGTGHLHSKIQDHQRDKVYSLYTVEKIQLALNTLGSFDLTGILLLPFVADYVVPYLHSSAMYIRKEAAQTVSKLLLRPSEPIPGRSQAAVLVSDILQELLAVGISDPAVEIRRCILGSIRPEYDVYLSQVNLLRSIFIALNDEDYAVKMKTMEVIRRVVRTNPAFVLPALRKVLKQHLTELKYGSSHKDQHNSLLLLGYLISASPTLVRPYIVDILQALMPKINAADPQVSASALMTLRQLTSVGQDVVAHFIHELTPLIVQQLQDNSSLPKMQVAMAALGKVIQCTDRPMAADASYPALARTLLRLVEQGNALPWSLQKETHRLLGLLGAVDPFARRLAVLNIGAVGAKASGNASGGSAVGAANTAGAAGAGGADGPGEAIVGSPLKPRRAIEGVDATGVTGVGNADDAPGGADNDDTGADSDFPDQYEPSLQDADFAEFHAIRNLVAILRDSSVKMYHKNAIHALMFVFRSHHEKCARFAPDVVGALLSVLDRCEPMLRGVVLQQFLVIIRITQHEFRQHVASLVNRCVTRKFWSSSLKPVLKILVALAHHMRDEFKSFLPVLMPKILTELQSPANSLVGALQQDHGVTAKARRPGVAGTTGATGGGAVKQIGSVADRTLLVIESLGEFGSALEEYVHLLIPLLVSLSQQHSQSLSQQDLEISELGSIFGVGQAVSSASKSTSGGRGGGGGTAQAALLQKEQLQIRVKAVRTLGLLATRLDLSEYASQIIHPLTRILKQPSTELELASDAMGTLCILIRQLGHESPWYSMLRRAFSQQQGGSGLARPVRRQFDMLKDTMEATRRQAGLGYDGVGAGLVFDTFGVVAGVQNRHSAMGSRAVRANGSAIGGGVLGDTSGLTSSLASYGDGLSLGRDMQALGGGVVGTPRRPNSHIGGGREGGPGGDNGGNTTSGPGVGNASASRMRGGMGHDPIMMLTGGKIAADQAMLQQAWAVTHRTTEDDWSEWIQRLSVELLRESPSGALRACFNLAQVHFALAKSLFTCAFMVTWVELRPELRQSLAGALQVSFASPNVSQEICQTILNLAEAMERNDIPLPIDIRMLGELARRSHVFAKALRYTELQYEAHLLTTAHTIENKQAIGSCIEALISINNELEYPDAAVGILLYAQQNRHVEDLQESWYEKLGRWKEALRGYNRRLHEAEADGASLEPLNALRQSTGADDYSRPRGGGTGGGAGSLDVWSDVLQQDDEYLSQQEQQQQQQQLDHGHLYGQNINRGFSEDDVPSEEIEHAQMLLELRIGKMRCLDALGEWTRLIELAQETWPYLQDEDLRETREALAPQVAKACWFVQEWSQMERYVAQSRENTVKGSLLRAVLAVHNDHIDSGMQLIDNTRRLIAPLLTPLAKEGYNRAYKHIVQLQQLSELEEILTYKRELANCRNGGGPADDHRRIYAEKFRLRLQNAWATRITSCQSNVDVWQSILAVRTLVTPHTVDTLTWLKFVAICRDNGCHMLSLKTLVSLGIDASAAQLLSLPPENGSRPRSDLGLSASEMSRFDVCQLDGSTILEGGAAADAASRLGLSRSRLDSLGGVPVVIEAGQDRHVKFAYLKQLHASGQRSAAITGLSALVDECRSKGWAKQDVPMMVRVYLRLGLWNLELSEEYATPDESSSATDGRKGRSDSAKPGGVSILPSVPNVGVQTTLVNQALNSFEKCTKLDKTYYKGWHHWAVANFELVETLKQRFEAEKQRESNSRQSSPTNAAASASGPNDSSNARKARYQQQYSEQQRAKMREQRSQRRQRDFKNHIRNAAEGFFRSIVLGRARSKSNVLQDILRLLTLWFSHGGGVDLQETFSKGFDGVPIDMWLEVVPQLIARIHTRTAQINTLLHRLLTRIGKAHPQALIYALSVPSASHIDSRRLAAQAVLSELRQQCGELVDQAAIVSSELIRVAILWHELWHGGLEEASRLYFGENNIEGLLETLYPLHETINRKENLTLREKSFQDAFGQDLAEAKRWLDRFVHTRAKQDINQAWDIYYMVFRRINKQLPGLSQLELPFVSPALQEARNLDLAVPGSYRAGEEVVKIARFVASVRVLSSKQRPRRITIVGSDGKNYKFLLKGHEDLRQDERVMQLFGLVNTLLSNNMQTARAGLSIQQYDVIPLSHNCGIVQWLPRCDTLHQLIRDYRHRRNILINLEHRHMLRMAPDYEKLPLLGRLEVFNHALSHSTGKDLCKLLWLKSQNTERWLKRRTTYTRSLAVMNMVGYILGLGDRHPSNLMLHRDSGQLIHVDFGDCFEVAQKREKFPEKIPFRLTRMMVNAMELSGIEGSYRKTSEVVMADLRRHRDSVMAMLEAFIHDPLINWRLLGEQDVDEETANAEKSAGNSPAQSGTASDSSNPPSARRSSHGNRQHHQHSKQQQQQQQQQQKYAPHEDPGAPGARTSPTHAPDGVQGDPAVDASREDEEKSEASADQKDAAPPQQQQQQQNVASPPTFSNGLLLTQEIAEEDEEDADIYDQADEEELLDATVAGAELDASEGDEVRLTTPPSRINPDGFAAAVSLKPASSMRIRLPSTPTRPAQVDGDDSEEDNSEDDSDDDSDDDTDSARGGTAIAVDDARTGPTFTQAREAQKAAAQNEGGGGGGGAAAAGTSVAKSFMEMIDSLHGAKRDDGVDPDDPLDRAPSSSSMSVAHSFRARSQTASFRSGHSTLGAEGAAVPPEAITSKAILAIKRVQAKLTGRDFYDEGEKEALDVGKQVDRLIREATSNKNLCQCYSGWCPFW